ncbi:MAG: hypothetical protein KAS02_02650 [Candidatus Pacebacteria bacterium]|nr:hypothetical protein [Candidatus Paceibacterota bacterium]
MQSIKEKLNKIKEKPLLNKQIGDSFVNNNQFFNTALIILVAFSSFGLGRLSIAEENGKNIITESLGTQNIVSINSSSFSAGEENGVLLTGKYIASRNSNLYHAPWCSGAQRIKEENQIWFNSKEEAEASGRSPASNCKGI